MLSAKCMAKANGSAFKRRVKYFMQKAATAIIGEDGAFIGHAERVAYAEKILSGEASIYEMAVGVVTNSTVAAAIDGGSEPSDSDLEFTVNSLINDFAGYDG